VFLGTANIIFSSHMIITDKIKLLPDSPGVYRYLDENGVVIYVGKAKNLKKRVSQYFQSPDKLTRKTAVMVSKIADVEHTVVDTEEDALLLENNLIKEYQPKYNILLKDGKTYPWICVKKEPFPRVFLTRKFKKDGSLYFGPYSSVMHAHKLLDLINALYRLRTCNLPLTDEGIQGGKYKVCLNYHIKKCLAPCVGYISPQEYKEQTDAIIEILKGNSAYLIREFDRKMKDAASKLEFEIANDFKEKKILLEKHYSKSMVVHSGIMDLDVFSLIFEGQDAFGNHMKVRNGCIIRSINLHIKMRIEEEQSSVLSQFMAEIYTRGDSEQDIVKEILVPFMPDQEFHGRNVHVPLKGDKLSVLELSRKNAAELKFDKLKQEEFVNPKEHTERILETLRRDLQMDDLPRHIECFDNSNIQGTNPVSACVVFKDAAPSKKDYRHFNIKSVVGANDFASMKEVVNRRYSRILSEGGELPQLIVIDGGKGQVRFAYEALLELGLVNNIKLIGIAERMEELIIPGDPYPMFLDKNSTSLKLIMQLRDEAHRFGITHHRSRRSKAQISSALDQINGVGPKTAEKLIAKYKSVARIKRVSEEELAAFVGPKLARAIKEGLG
jgi:excinuclease ABC subunit C